MGNFVVNTSQALSIGGTAADVELFNNIVNAAGIASLPAAKKGRLGRIRNTHATQVLYLKKSGTCTTANADVIIPAGAEVTFGLPLELDKVSMIASGASTTGVLWIGDEQS